MFKRIFGAEDRKHLLSGLLNALLALDEMHRIVEIEHLPATRRVKLSELRLSILDVKCTDAAGTSYVVKMQILLVEAFERHLVYGVAEKYTMQLRGGGDDPALNDVVGVTLCDFVL